MLLCQGDNTFLNFHKYFKQKLDFKLESEDSIVKLSNKKNFKLANPKENKTADSEKYSRNDKL